MNDLTSTKILSSCIAHVSYYKIGTKYMPIIGRLRYMYIITISGILPLHRENTNC